jgi:exodeoxyribonuclease VII large subunit
MAWAPRTGEPRVLRVGELVAELSALVADAVGRVWVIGEISNLRRAASGHHYFTLKDDAAQLRAVLFRADAERLAFAVEDGLEALAFGEVSIYGARGELQLVVRQLEPRGQGALRLAFEQLRVRLEHEGLFDAGRKRALPRFPRAIGVVTSTRGAAVRDVIEVTGARFPSVPLLVAEARVQGDGADLELVEALQLLAARREVEVILLVRGGGSLEDLWPFNSEVLARAIARCPVPVVAGVGHETDVTIADWVADARAPTPSAAAALVVADRRELLARLARDRGRLRAAIAARLGRERARLAAGRDALRHTSPAARLAARRARLGRDAHRLVGAMRLRLERAATRLRAPGESMRRAPLALGRARAQLALAAGRLDSLSPLAVLGRGYAIARRAADGRIVRDPADVAPGDALAVRVAGGEIDAAVTATRARRDA